MDDPKECWSCEKRHSVNENGLCANCKNESRSIDDCWLVQEFRKRYSEGETQEAIRQIFSSDAAKLHLRQQVKGGGDE